MERTERPTGGGENPPPGGSESGRADDVDLPTRRSCGTMDVHRRLLTQVASYPQRRAEIENLALEYEQGTRVTARTGITRIPVVVHVIWNTEAQNISDAQIQSQIDVLNRDFRRLNPDRSKVPAIWQSLVGDARIEFFLATQDPEGRPTTGITRTPTPVPAFATDDSVKSSATGGADPWPSDRYLNIWVCQLGSNLLGYAQFPGGPAATDGVVITHTAFGTTGTAAPPFNLGRTATHEVGHWLNLFHIWGDDGTGCAGTDFVGDTPNQAGPNYGCPDFPHITCGNGPNGDMFMNFMDYVNDDCMVMFTNGHVTRMDATLDGPRASLLTGAPPVATRPNPASRAAVAWGANRLDVFAPGIRSALYHTWWDGAAWRPSATDWESLDGTLRGQAEAVAWGANRLDVFVIGSRSGLYHKWWDGSGWRPSATDWESLGGILKYQPKIVAWGPNRLDVFIISTDSALYYKWWDGTAWRPSATDWESLGGTIRGQPEAVSWGPNRLDLFVTGTRSGVYHKWWDGSAWLPSRTGWESLGGTFIGGPKAVTWGPNRLDVFAVGLDSAVYHKWWDGSGWRPSATDWEPLGGTSFRQPDVVAWGTNRLDVLALGTDSAVHHKWWDGSTWQPSPTGWESLGGTFMGGPQAVAWGPNRLDVLALGTNAAMHHKWWDGTAWQPSLTGYEPIGGVSIDF